MQQPIVIWRRPALAVALLVGSAAHAQQPPAQPSPYCAYDYADDLAAASPRVREYERQSYSYSVRNTATYECLSYGLDGNVRRMRKRAVMHGTAFAYKQIKTAEPGGETLLATNQHVAEWPAVTDEEHPVDAVPMGCKKVADALRIVDSERDAYERDDIALVRVASDPQLDVAILKAHALLHVLPWKIGRSAALRERNVVEVRGFPLGAFQAINVGKVVSAYDHDSYREWEHDDFVVDALLSSGHSGSPVLAVSCKTGELELVGIYHAGYSEGSALNVVVGIDQVRDLMTTLKRSVRGHSEGVAALDARDRARLASEVRTPTDQFFPFGQLTAQVQRRSDGALVFQVLSRDFPLKVHAIMVMEDLKPAPAQRASFGELGRVWFGGAGGLKPYLRPDLDADTQAALNRFLDTLRRDAVTAHAYRAAVREAGTSRERYDQMARLERAFRRTIASRREQAQGLTELADRLSPHGADSAQTIADAFAVPADPPGNRTADGSAPPLRR